MSFCPHFQIGLSARSIMTEHGTLNASTNKSTSNTQLSVFGGGVGEEQVYTQTAMYKGMLVAVKNVEKRNLSFSREDLMELKCVSKSDTDRFD